MKTIEKFLLEKYYIDEYIIEGDNLLEFDLKSLTNFISTIPDHFSKVMSLLTTSKADIIKKAALEDYIKKTSVIDASIDSLESMKNELLKTLTPGDLERAEKIFEKTNKIDSQIFDQYLSKNIIVKKTAGEVNKISKLDRIPYILKGAAVIVVLALIAYGAHLIYVKNFSEKAKACKSKKGKDKTICILQFELNSYEEIKKELMNVKYKANDTKDPSKFKHGIDKQIDKYNEKINNVKIKLAIISKV